MLRKAASCCSTLALAATRLARKLAKATLVWATSAPAYLLHSGPRFRLLKGEIRLFHLLLAGPQVGPGKHERPVRFDHAADHFLNAVLVLKEGAFGVDPGHDNRHQIGRDSAALQKRLRITELQRRAILRVERKYSRPKT